MFPVLKTKLNDYSTLVSVREILLVYLCIFSLYHCLVSDAVYGVDSHFVFNSGESHTFDILNENELIDRANGVAVICLFLPITTGQNASH